MRAWLLQRSAEVSAAACLGGAGKTWGRAQGERQPIEPRVVGDGGHRAWPMGGAGSSPAASQGAAPPAHPRHVRDGRCEGGGRGSAGGSFLWQVPLLASPRGGEGEPVLPLGAVQGMVSPQGARPFSLALCGQ